MASEPSTAAAQRGPTSGVHQALSATGTPKPLLASEVLRDELAPKEPARQAIRIWLVVAAALLVALGLAFRHGVGVPTERLDSSTLSFSAAGALGALALLPFPYALRAGVAFLLGAALMALGFRGAGPMAGIAVDGGLLRDLGRLVTLTALPAALLFRAHYRAYRRARVMLAAALALAMPFVVVEVMLAINPAAALLPRIAAGADVVVIGCSLLGFMGEGTTGAGTVWAALVLAVLPLEIAVRQLTPLAEGDTGWLTYPATAVAILCAGLLTSLGLFQLLSAALAGDARRVSSPMRLVDEDDSGLEQGGPVG